MNTRLREIYDSLRGVKRDRNEDKALIIEESEYKLYILFDGVGSAFNSIEAIKLASQFITKNHKSFFKNGTFDLSEMMWQVNSVLVDSTLIEPYTTYVIVYVPFQTMWKMKFSNLGDSRLYGITQNYIHQYSQDNSSSRHTLTKCLGLKSLSREDFVDHEIESTDRRYMLCTDGFYTLLEKEIEFFFHLLNYTYLTTLKKRLRESIKSRNSDDSTYILIQKDV